MLVHGRPLIHRDDRFWSRRAAAQSAVGSDGVVVPPPLFDDDLCLFQGIEDLAIQQFVPVYETLFGGTPARQYPNTVRFRHPIISKIPDLLDRANPGRHAIRSRWNVYSTGKPPTQSELWQRRYLSNLVWDVGGRSGQHRGLLGLEQEAETSSPKSSAILKTTKRLS